MSINELFNLNGKTILVTGGAGHLGEAISKGLAAAGANVFIASRNLRKCEDLAGQLTKEYNVKSKGLFLDIADETSVKECVNEMILKEGHIDVLINNASFSSKGDISDMDDITWKKGIDGTINGVFRCTKEVLPYMIKQKQGVIINISSMYGVVSPDPSIYGETGFNNPPNYGAGKAAVIQFTKYIACHYGKYGIRANSVAPGPFPKSEVQSNEHFINELSKKNPLGRIGKPDELKGVMILLSSSASSYITGENISVDGGWTAW